MVRTSFKAVEEELPSNRFLRIHKSNAISVDAVTAIRKNSVFLGDKELSIGETYREDVERLLRN